MTFTAVSMLSRVQPDVNTTDTVTVQLTPLLEEAIQDLVRREDFPNRSELIRCAVRDLLLRYGSLGNNG